MNEDGLWKPRETRREAVARMMDRLDLSAEKEDSIIAQRKAAEAKERLRRQDLMFGTYWGETLGVPWSAGDEPEARDD